MKKSILLKIISFAFIPVCLAVIILSGYSILTQNDYKYSEKKYYSSQKFVGIYMTDLSKACEDLIYHNSNYSHLEDGDKTIYYTDNEEYQSNVKELKYLIIYRNKALTNIELDDSTKTIEGIKNFLAQTENSKKVRLVNGNISADNDMIQRFGVQYFDNLTNRYYTKTQTGNTSKEESIVEENIEYVTTNYSDFEVYSFYIEEFKEDSKEAIILSILNAIPMLQEYHYILIPVCTILILLMIIYLIMAVGNDEKLVGIDHIPYEILTFLAILLACIPFGILEAYSNNASYNFNATLSFIITIFVIIYTILGVCIATFIRRIKAKSFWRTTLIGKFCYWIKEKILKTINYSLTITTKVILYGLGIGFIALAIIFLFGDNVIAFLLEFLLFGKILYDIIRFLKDYSKIEEKLKEMKEGNNQTELKIEEFIPALQNTADCMNHISEGVETAVQERMKSEKLKAELITNVSHDIKTPLTSIINYVDLLKEEKIENEKAKEYIGILESKSQRLKKLTEDLVEASKVSTGNISLNMEKINIVELLRQAVGEFEDKFRKKGLDTILDSDQSEFYIMADSRYMYRVIENLFSNISKYALENSRVYIDLKQAEKKVQIEIKNISREKLNISAEELMQRFVRGDTARTTEGSGLGISIAQNLTELQQGKFSLVLDGDLFKVKMEFNLI